MIGNSWSRAISVIHYITSYLFDESLSFTITTITITVINMIAADNTTTKSRAIKVVATSTKAIEIITKKSVLY